MNKKDIFLIAGVVLILVIALFAVGGNNAEKVELPIALSGEESGLIGIDYTAYESKIENGENFIVVIERTGCSYCEMYLPVLEEVTAEISIPVYYIDTAELTQEEFSALSESNSYLKREQWGTPTTLLMSGDVVVANISGYVEKEDVISFIEENIILVQEENADVE